MPSLPTSTPSDQPPFPPPQTFDILPQIYDLVSRLPSSLPPSTTSTTPQLPISDRLDPKDLPTAALPIKHKIQKARAAVSALPDVDRTIEEQEDEIRELEERIEKSRGMVAELKRRAGAGKREVEADGEGREN
jgi:RNA polymerase II transcription mediator complex subunit 9